jgi:hypothetical protein
MGLSEVKNELKKLDKNKLIDLISDLYKKNKSVKEYLDFHSKPDEKTLFTKYRNMVYEAFYPKHGYSIKLREGKKAISDFKKLGASTDLVADLMLFYVETGTEYTKCFGDIDEAYYSSIEGMFARALELMSGENLLDRFASRARAVYMNSDDIGWGFSDTMAEIYYSFYHDDITVDD